MAGNYMYKPIKSSTKSRKTFIAHKQWTITDETAPTFNVQQYFGRFSNGSFSIGDINDSNVANEPQTNGKYDRVEICIEKYTLFLYLPVCLVTELMNIL